MKKIILHCDLNNFFASAALIKNPTLRGLPIAVCGDEKKRHGIVLAKNNIAKSYGISTAETVWEARRKCPNLVILSPDYKLYKKISLEAHKIYLDYSDKVEPFGIDECWIDISNMGTDFKTGEITANEIRSRIKRELGVTISVGVSFNKTFAKLGSDLKKPDAVTVITPDNYIKKIYPLSCSNLIMVGKSAIKSLNQMGIFTIGDLASADENALRIKMGKSGVCLKHTAQGNENSNVRSYYDLTQPKSISNSATTERDFLNYDEVYVAFLKFSEQISAALQRHKLVAGGIAVHTVTNDFIKREYSTSLDVPTDISASLAQSAFSLFKKNCRFEKPFRNVGIRVFKLAGRNDSALQLSMFEDKESLVQSKIDEEMMLLRDKYGENIIYRAICMKEDKTLG